MCKFSIDPNLARLRRFLHVASSPSAVVKVAAAAVVLITNTLASLPAVAAIYTASKDFQTTVNPGATWSYGYSVEGGAAYSFILFDKHVDDTATSSASGAWSMTNYNVAGAPVAWLNSAPTSRYGVGSGQVSLHPGPRPLKDFAILRFTAPQTASYKIAGQFFAGDSGSMSARVLLNSGFGDPLNYFAVTNDSSTFNAGPVTLLAGQTIDFVVGNNGDFSFGNTPVAVTIESDTTTTTDAQAIREYVNALPRLTVVPPLAGTVGPMPNLPEGLSATQRSGGTYVNNEAELVLLKSFPDIMWPGALVQGASIDKNDFAPIIIPRAPGRVRLATLFVNGTASPRFRDLANIDAGSVEAARDEMLAAINPTGSVGKLLYETQVAATAREAMVKLGIAYKGSSASGSLDASLNTTYSEKTLFAKFTQEFYSLNFDPDQNNPSPFFGANVKLQDVKAFANASNPPLFVSEVKYGRIFLVSFTSNQTMTEMQLAVSAAYSNIKGSIDARTREALSKMTMKVLVIGSTGESALKSLQAGTPETAFEALREYIQTGINYSAANPGGPISMTMRYVGSRAGLGPFGVAVAQMVTDESPQVVDVTAQRICHGPYEVWDGAGGGWHGTDVSVNPGDTVDFSATGKNWSGVFATGDYGPTGWYTWDKPSGSGFPITNRSPFALIGRFGNGNDYGNDATKPDWDGTGPVSSSFFIGDSQKVVAGSKNVQGYGPVYLGTNDSDPTNGDKNKKFKVDVCVTRAIF